MTKQFWLNLPVKNIQRSKEFFTRLGFGFNTQHGDTEHSAGLVMGEKGVVVMLFEETMFKNFLCDPTATLSPSTEVLLSIDAESKEEVDELAAKAVAAGGTSPHKPGEMKGWMYGCVFTDLDGHKWNVLYMDMSKMPRG
jgi:predicted lactoylglutathione lyase